MTRDEFRSAVTRALSDHATASVSVFRYLPADLLTPVSAFLRLRSGSRFSFLLESVEGGEQLARYSFIGTNPSRVVKAHGPHTFVEQHGEALEPAKTADGNVLEVLAREVADAHLLHDPSLPPFTSGAVGYMGYDVVRLFERLPDTPPDDLELPDAAWGVFDSVVAFDHARQVIVAMTRVGVSRLQDEQTLNGEFERAMRELNGIAETLDRGGFSMPEPLSVDHHAMSRSTTQEAYEQSVERAREYIRTGEIFQVVLSQRVDMPFAGDAFNLYRSLRQTNPSPYLFYLDIDGTAVIGSSPESLVRIQDSRVSTVPIAGTRRRGETPEEDKALAIELATDPKELAEHVMLVDLGRNDIGRVSAPGTVAVEEFQSVVRYSHVMHLVSLVAGSLGDEHDAVDALRACFPAGTVSGAPKVRAMEIIDELEPRRRGLYAGAVGYLDFSGNMDVCIAIRTIVASGGHLYMQAGAGIVADSRPDLEWEETENKLRALLAATIVAAKGFAAT